MKVRFIVKNNFGSSIMRGHQIAQYLKKDYGVDAECLTEVPKDEEGLLLVFVKTIDPSEVIEAAKKHICIYDPVDRFCQETYMADMVAFDQFAAVIYPTDLQVTFFSKFFSKNHVGAVIRHHFDPRVLASAKEFAAYPYTLRFGYIGAEFNHEFKDDLPDILPIYHEYNWINWAGFFTCHTTFREPGTPLSMFKPATKVATAAAVNANIITTRDNDAVELLGKDYPYFVEEYSAKGVFEIIKKSRNDFDNERWYEGLAKMKEVREKTDIKNICGQYNEMFKYLHGGGR